MSPKHLCFRWAVDLKGFKPSLTQLTTACSSVQQEERTRLMRFHFIDDFLSSLVGRLLMRKFVSETTHIPYNEIIFDRDVRGKPYLKNSKSDSPQISFNVSHSGSKIVLAGLVMEIDHSLGKQTLSPADFGVGIDVMKIEYTGGKTLSEFFRIMTRNFSDIEWRNIYAHETDNAKLKAFMRHWCLKESYVKNIGVGIAAHLQDISFTVQSDDLVKDKVVTNTTLQVKGIPAALFKFEEHMLDADYCVAIAFKNCAPIAEGAFKFFSFDELLVCGDDTGSAAAELEEYCRKALQKDRK